MTDDSGDWIVLMSAEDLESVEATLEPLSDPAAQERVREAQAQIAQCDYVTGDETAAIIAQRRRRNAPPNGWLNRKTGPLRRVAE